MLMEATWASLFEEMAHLLRLQRKLTELLFCAHTSVRYAISVSYSLPGQCSNRSSNGWSKSKQTTGNERVSLLHGRAESRLAACQPRADKMITNRSSHAFVTCNAHSASLRSCEQVVGGDFARTIAYIWFLSVYKSPRWSFEICKRSVGVLFLFLDSFQRPADDAFSNLCNFLLMHNRCSH